jgi:hypothetical protein
MFHAGHCRTLLAAAAAAQAEMFFYKCQKVSIFFHSNSFRHE